LVLACLALHCLSFTAFANVPKETTEWLQAHAVPLSTDLPGGSYSDLKRLNSTFDSVSIVGLGEPTHGTREAFQMKHRLIEYLVREKGFSVFAIEANMPETHRLNDYVLGGAGDVEALVKGMVFWTWSTEEVRDLAEWMRAYNLDPENKKAGRQVKWEGFDMQFSALAAQEVKRFVEKELPAESKAVTSLVAESAMLSGQDFQSLVATLPVEGLAGKNVRLSGWIKTNLKGRGWAGLWCRADSPGHPCSAFDNMMARAPRGSEDWRQYEAEITVPPDATNINFGVLVAGAGTAWFDDLQLSVEAVPMDPKGKWDFAFEKESLEGFSKTTRKDYSVSLASDSHRGDHSLRISKLDDGAAHQYLLNEWRALARRLHAQLQKRTDPETSWALQNAAIVVQGLEMRLNQVSRDEAMANNVAWLRQRYPGEKIILWAHNGHIWKDPERLGGYLSKRHPAEYLAVGFATAAGEYRAYAKDLSGLKVLPLQPPERDSVEALALQLGIERLIVDLRALRDEKSAPGEWFRGKHGIRMIGAEESDEQFIKVPLSQYFDLLVYQHRTQASRPLPEGN